MVYQSQYHWDILIQRGPIGDFFSGTIGPITNLAGVVLVYLSFQVQIKANDIQYDGLQKSLDVQLKTHNFECLEKSLDSIISEGLVFFSKRPRYAPVLPHYDDNITHFHFHDTIRNYILTCAQFGYFLLQAELLDNNKPLLYYKYLVFMRGAPSLYVKTLGKYFLSNSKFDINNKQHKDIEIIIENIAIVLTETETRYKEIIANTGIKFLCRIF
jgi:hypothetical protein